MGSSPGCLQTRGGPSFFPKPFLTHPEAAVEGPGRDRFRRQSSPEGFSGPAQELDQSTFALSLAGVLEEAAAPSRGKTTFALPAGMADLCPCRTAHPPRPPGCTACCREQEREGTAGHIARGPDSHDPVTNHLCHSSSVVFWEEEHG